MAFENTLQMTEAMAAGNPAAIEAFYRSQFDLMLYDARRCTGCDESTGLDLVHDAMLKSLHSIRPLPTPEALKAWTRRLIRSVCIDHLRSRERRLHREQRSARNEASEPDDNSELMQTRARIVWIEEQLQEMSEPSSTLIQLRYFCGLTLQQIAKSLGLKAGAVDGRIRRIVEQLKRESEAFQHEST
ncbi:MAG: sigma-70 family RNA polymerase sigma factor [Planctomycetaceae bacterium]|nr:sigma-70 family RNA polymerase sigma factor [Planctomycetaceae bacterium]MCB9951432.1 sigma-70 family RNA polymerase sigma factor [Planctomycetaceae bacterium]